MKSMIEHSIAYKAIGMVLKTLFLPVIAFVFAPLYDLMILLAVEDYSVLSPLVKAILNDAKLILGVLVIAFTLVKLVVGSFKIKQEIEAIKNSPPTPKSE